LHLTNNFLILKVIYIVQFIIFLIIAVCLSVVEQFQQTKLTLPLDVLAYASAHLPVSSLPQVFVEGIVRQLHAMAHCLLTHSQVFILFALLL